MSQAPREGRGLQEKVFVLYLEAGPLHFKPRRWPFLKTVDLISCPSIFVKFWASPNLPADPGTNAANSHLCC